MPRQVTEKNCFSLTYQQWSNPRSLYHTLMCPSLFSVSSFGDGIPWTNEENKSHRGYTPRIHTWRSWGSWQKYSLWKIVGIVKGCSGVLFDTSSYRRDNQQLLSRALSLGSCDLTNQKCHTCSNLYLLPRAFLHRELSERQNLGE